jgi:FkbM family methyltransferase
MNKVKRCRHGLMLYQPHDTVIGRSLDLYGEYSEGEVALFRHAVARGATVLDIGAHIGAHTVPLAQFTGPGGRVLAFEPQRTLYYCLCANVVLNNLANVFCHQVAVAEASGFVRVPEMDYSVEQNFGGVGLAHDYAGSPTYNVPATRIDDLQLTTCHFVKIDVEGMEQHVLQGAVETIGRHRPLLYLEDDRPEKSAALRALLNALDYNAFLHRPLYFNPANLANNQQNVFPNTASFNLFCHPREASCPVDAVAFGLEPIR